MSKFYKPQLLRITVAFLIGLFFTAQSFAQIDITVGTGTVGNGNTEYPCPLQDYFEGGRAQYLYRASELTALGMGPGTIGGLRWSVTAINGFTGTVEQFSIRIGTTTATTLNAATWENITNTVVAPVNYIPVLGVNTFNFTTPYFWNGVDNLVIEVCNGDPTNSTAGVTTWTGNVTVPWTTGLAFNGSHTYRADNEDNLCGTASVANTGTLTNRPNVTLLWTPATACSGTPTGGTISANPTTVCLGQSFSLSITGGTVASGLTYQWQSSPDNVTYTNIPGATSPFLTTTQSASTWYRRVTTCTNGGASANSTTVQVVSPTLVSGTFTINNALPTGGTNFNSFNAAYDYIKCGINGPVVFNVVSGSGPYTEQLIMDAVPGSSNVNTVTFNGNGRTLQFLSTNTNERAVIKLNNTDHIRFDSLTINALATATTQFGYGIQLINNADSNIIRNCTININAAASTSTSFGGIIMNFSATSATTTGNTLCDGNTFNNNTINGGHYGITMVGSTTVSVQRNKVTNNRFRDQYLYALYLLGNFDALIEGNDITKANATISPTLSYGIFVTQLNTKVLISKNRIHDIFNAQLTTANDFYAITHSGTDALATLENIVVNNAIYDIRGNGTIYGIYNTSSDNIWYYHNTIALDNAASTSTEAARGFFQTTLAGGIEFRNNMVTIRRGGTGQKHGIYMATTTTTYISNNNNYFLNNNATSFVGFNGTNQVTLANWQTASGKDANSSSSDPLYASAATGLLRPTNASINDLGGNLSANLTVANDIDNVARAIATPDMGAWEFTPEPCVAPPTPGTSTTSISGPVCPNTPGNFNLTGNSIGLTQTYQWEFSTSLSGPYASIGPVTSNPSFNYIVTQTGYFRCVVTCAQQSATSVPVLVNVNGALPGGTYTINSAVATGGTNFQSFNHAYQAMRCGILGPIIMNVVPGSGPYNEQLIMDSIAGTSAINTITFNGNGRTIAFSSSDGNERAVIKLRGTDHITFDSLTINATGAGTFGYGVQLISNADSNTFRRCNIITVKNNTSTNYAGIVVNATDAGTTTTGATNCDNNRFERNTVTGGFYGITLAAAAATPMFNNKVLNNTFIDYYSFGTYLQASHNTAIIGNDYSRPTNTNVTTHYGVYFINSALGDTVANNKIHDPFNGAPTSTSVFYGIFFTGADGTAAQPNRVYNNILYRINGNSDQYGIYNTSSDYALYYHNTLNHDDQLSTYSTADWTRSFFQTTSPVGVEFKNNLITISRTGAGTRHAVYLASGTSGITLDNNNYLVTNGGPLAGAPFIGFNGTDQATLANWKASTGQEANTINVNPVYINAAVGNLEPISPVIDNKGTPVGIPADIRGLARSATTPDIGAYELAILPCTAPPPVATATANPNNNICIGAMIQLRVPGIAYTAGQTYQWQTSTTAAGPYTNLGESMLLPDTAVMATATLYYRCVLTCSGQSTPSNPALVTLNPAFLAGTYTINSTIPASATNFTSFNAAVAALYCGITGHVIFDVSPHTYTEQVRIGNVPGVGPNATVTFKAANGVAATSILTFNSTNAATNYTLRLDSARYFTFKNLTINGTNATNGRVIELAGTAANDSIANCVITSPTVTSASTNAVGIFSNSIRGNGQNVILKNTINGGSSGIYLAGFNVNNTSSNNVIDSNTINGSYQYNMYLQFMRFVKVRGNMLTVTAPRVATTYGLYMINNDSAIVVQGNTVNVSALTVTNFGMYFTTNRATIAAKGMVLNNKVSYGAGVTGSSTAIYQTSGISQLFLNNVAVVSTTSTTAYGLFHTNGTVEYYNNSINNISPATGTTSVAGYLSQTSGSQSRAINNIFAHNGGGRAILMSNSNFIYSDYNMLYTSGTVLGTFGTAAVNNLRRWIDTTGWDYNSITFKPAFISNTNLEPDLASPDVWGIHGRGTQIAGNATDFNGNPRPVTVQTGVPDLGAYEFVPTSVPVTLVATPAAPAPNTTQKFSLGTDTVSIIKWGATVPASITGKRYTGTKPSGLGATQPFMYFYTDYDAPTGSYNYEMQQAYMDPWVGTIPSEGIIKMGRTDAANAWIVSPISTVDTLGNIIKEGGLTFIDKYTGLTDGLAAVPPIDPVVLDTSNRGTRFWVAYGHHQFFSSTNTQQMVLYLGGSPQPATVTVRINGTPWVRTYTIPANTVITSDIITKSGLYDARILQEGESPRGISIVSDVPIVAYAHIYGSAASGATMLLPVGTYGYDYTALTSRQNYASDCFSWFFIVADRNNTVVEITPSRLTRGGRAAGVPFTVTLNKGEVYQVLGEIQSGSEGFDLTGSRAKAIPNSAGKCLPFAFFSGSSRTGIGCGTSAGGSGDNIIQQNFPFQAWGKKYLTAPTSNATAANNFMTNIFKIAVKDPATQVTLTVGNGAPTVLPPTSLINGQYYQIEASVPTFIDADKPITVAQFMSSSGSCPNTTGNGDPEMFYISPLEQGIKRVTLYRNTQQAITSNYLTLIVPTAGVASLTIDGSNTFDFTVAHPSLTGYTVVVRRWTAAQAQTIVNCDSAFTAITYGLGSVESYGYNAGTLVKNLNAVSSISNVLSGAGNSPYTCKGTPFRFNVLLTVKPSLLTWQFSQVPGLTPSTDLTQTNPTPTDSALVNGVWFYNYTVAQDFVYNNVGTFILPLSLVHPTIESCNSSLDITVSVTVLPKPVTDFTTVFSGCVGDAVQFSGTSITNNASPITQWSWNFGDATTGVGQTTSKLYANPGTYNVQLRAVGADGCLGDTTKPVVVNPRPTANVVTDSISTCIGSNATFNIQNPVAGATYNWYTAATGGTLLGTGTSYTFTNVSVNVVAFVEAIQNGCVSLTRKRVVVNVLPLLTAPVAVVDTAGVNFISFKWNAVPNALTYSVSTNNGTSWQTPSSGPTGLTHRVTGLSPVQSVTLLVRANGGCQDAISAPVTGRTLTDQIYFPNSFTPNGDGRNDTWQIYGYVIKDLRMMVFNQWGEKIFETRNQSQGWNGTYKGKKQPSGVYMYVAELVLTDGSKQLYKGEINLIQ